MRVPLFRLYSAAQGDHFYTTSADERDNAIAQYGYVSEGIACYVDDGAGPPGETLRDRFAMAFMVTRFCEDPNELAARAYVMADAMLRARA